MKSIINELWRGNICPQTDSRNNSSEMKELMEYMSRHHDDLLKTMTEVKKEILRSLMTVGASIRAMPRKPFLLMLSNSVCRSLSKL